MTDSTSHLINLEIASSHRVNVPLHHFIWAQLYKSWWPDCRWGYTLKV